MCAISAVRYGEKPNASPATIAASSRLIRNRTRRYAANADSGQVRKSARLYASTGLPLSQYAGVNSTPMPTRLSVKALMLSVGKYCGAFHHAVENGSLVAFHQSTIVLNAGSPASLARTVRPDGRRGHV